MANYLSAAKKAARAAGRIQLRHFKKGVKARKKGRVNLVTRADVECEKKIVSLLSKAFPGHDFILEEGHRERLGSRFVWVVDPLDGTNNFTHKIPIFCSSIALLKDGEPVVGVTYSPMNDEMFYAEKGRGAFLNGKRIRVSRAKKLIDSMVVTGWPYERTNANRAKIIRWLRRLFKSIQGIRRTGSAATDLAWLSCGRFDAYYEGGVKAWDVAAGKILVEEAGGKVTDFKGKPLNLFGGKILASNGKIHAALRRRLGT